MRKPTRSPRRILTEAERTVILLPRDLRSATFLTDEIDIPQDVSKFMSIAFDIPEDDLRNPALTAALQVETSPDGGKTWDFQFGFTWQGNSAMRNGILVGAPKITTSELWRIAGKRIRARLTLSAPMTLGITLERG